MSAYPPVSAYLNGNCPAGTTLAFFQNGGPTLPAQFPYGTYLISYAAYPEANGQPIGQPVSCIFRITVVQDLQPPVFQYCPPNITIYGTLDINGNCTATGQWPLPIVTDNCGQITFLQSNIPCGSTLGVGTHTITYTAYDSFNSSTCSFTVTVLCPSGTGGPGALPYVLEVYPNPNSGVFTVELPEPAGAGMRFQVTDLTGRLLLEKELELGGTQQLVDTGRLAGGLYFLQVISEGRIIGLEKFVKQ